MNRNYYNLSAEETEQLQHTSGIGSTMAKLIKEGQAILGKDVYLKSSIFSFLISSLILVITFFIPTLTKYFVEIGIVSFILSMGVFIGFDIFDKINSRSEEFQKIDEELEDLIEENPNEGKILQEIIDANF